MQDGQLIAFAVGLQECGTKKWPRWGHSLDCTESHMQLRVLIFSSGLTR